MENNFERLLFGTVDDVRKPPDKRATSSGYFPRRSVYSKVSILSSPSPPCISRQALTVSPGVALCRAHSVLVPGSSALAPALSFSAVALPRYRPAGRY